MALLRGRNRLPFWRKLWLESFLTIHFEIDAYVQPIGKTRCAGGMDRASKPSSSMPVCRSGPFANGFIVRWIHCRRCVSGLRYWYAEASSIGGSKLTK